MTVLRDHFDSRSSEIAAYLDLLDGIESAIEAGVPRLGDGGATITTEQQRILYAGVYLQLYNLIESTVVRGLESISRAAMEGSAWMPGDLSDQLRKEWVKHTARTNLPTGPEKRLEDALGMVAHLIAATPVAPFDIEKGGGGNWDDAEIERVLNKLGLALALPPEHYGAVKRPIRDGRGAMGLIVDLRNDLAHGSISFAECGANETAGDLRALHGKVVAYLDGVVTAFDDYIVQHGFLRPERRPA